MGFNDRYIQSVTDDSRLSNKEKLDKLSEHFMSEGYLTILRTDNQLQMLRKKKFSFFWAFIWLLLWGVGLLVYIFYYMSKDDEKINITLEPESTPQPQAASPTTHDLVKLAELLEKGLITREEFDVQKARVFAN